MYVLLARDGGVNNNKALSVAFYVHLTGIDVDFWIAGNATEMDI